MKQKKKKKKFKEIKEINKCKFNNRNFHKIVVYKQDWIYSQLMNKIYITVMKKQNKVK